MKKSLGTTGAHPSLDSASIEGISNLTFSRTWARSHRVLSVRYEIPYLVSHISYPVSHPMYLVSHILYFKSHVGLFTPCTVREVRDTVSCISGVECEIQSTGRFVLRISIRYVFRPSGTRQCGRAGPQSVCEVEPCALQLGGGYLHKVKGALHRLPGRPRSPRKGA